MNRSKQACVSIGILLLLVIGAGGALVGISPAAAEDVPQFDEADCECEDLGWAPSDDHSGFHVHETFNWLDHEFEFPVTELHCEYSRAPGRQPPLTLEILYTADPEKTQILLGHYVDKGTGEEDACSQRDNCTILEKEFGPGAEYALLTYRRYEGPRNLLCTGGRALVHLGNYLIVASGRGYNDDFPDPDSFRNAVNRLMEHGVGLVNDIEGIEPERDRPPEYPSPRDNERFAGFLQWHSGAVELNRLPSEDWLQVVDGLRIFTGDRIRTLEDGAFQFRFPDSSRITRVSSNSLAAIPTASGDDPARLEVFVGHVWNGIQGLRPGERFNVKTPNAILSVEGTEFELVVGKNEVTTVRVFEGTVEASDLNGAEAVNIEAGHLAMVEGSQAPTEPEPFDVDAVDRWWEAFPDELDLEPEPEPEPEPTSEPSPTEEPVIEDESESGGTNIALIIVPIVVVAAIAGLAIFMVLRRRKRKEGPVPLAFPTSPDSVVETPPAVATSQPVPPPSVPREPALKSPVCPKCNYRGRAGERFCRKCGTPMISGTGSKDAEPAPGKEPSGDVACAKCGASNAAGSLFCKKCGSRLG